jgi:hypothetical protein
MMQIRISRKMAITGSAGLRFVFLFLTPTVPIIEILNKNTP